MYLTVISSFTIDCPYRLCEGASPVSTDSRLGALGPYRFGAAGLGVEGCGGGTPTAPGTRLLRTEEAVANRFISMGILSQARAQRQAPGVRPHSLVCHAIFSGGDHNVDRLKVEK